MQQNQTIYTQKNEFNFNAWFPHLIKISQLLFSIWLRQQRTNIILFQVLIVSILNILSCSEVNSIAGNCHIFPISHLPAQIPGHWPHQPARQPNNPVDFHVITSLHILLESILIDWFFSSIRLILYILISGNRQCILHTLLLCKLQGAGKKQAT